MLQSKQHLSKDLLGPMIMGQIISVDDWVPERPPKNPMLRVPSPDLPPPPPMVAPNDNDLSLVNQDEPLPPPPPEILRHMRQLSEPEAKLNPTSRRNSFAGQSNNTPLFHRTTDREAGNPPPTLPIRPQIITSQIITSTSASNPIQLQRRPSSSMSSVKSSSQMAQGQTVHAQRVLIAKTEPVQPAPRTAVARLSDSRLSLRKRTHNSKELIINKNPVPPPPLKPRMRNIFTDISNNNTNTTTTAANGSPSANKSR